VKTSKGYKYTAFAGLDGDVIKMTVTNSYMGILGTIITALLITVEKCVGPTGKEATPNRDTLFYIRRTPKVKRKYVN
jgi:hypothetical protein